MQDNRIHNGSRAVDAVLYALALVIGLLALYPMYYILILSVSEPQAARIGNVYLWPRGFFLGSYKVIVGDSKMWDSYVYTILYVVSGTALMLLTSVMGAYPLTVKHLFGRKFIVAYLIIPMYFGGGLIPTYLLMTGLGLYNNIWAIIIPSAVSIWNIILVRTYFHGLPPSLRESALIDGASNLQILFRIYAPLSKPILAVVAIYTVVGIWNSWFNAMVYLPNQKLQPLQMYLRRVLIEQNVDLTKIISMREMDEMNRKLMTGLQLRYSMIIFTTLPVLLAYPFFQKYFVKGAMLGSLKE